MPLPHSTLLQGQRILVVQNSYLIAQELTEALEREGVGVVGPVFTLRDAVKLVLKATKLDTAILDATLRGKMIWPVADILATRRVRLVFATGYDAFSLRRRYDGCQVVQKPILANAVVRLLTMEQFAAYAV